LGQQNGDELSLLGRRSPGAGRLGNGGTATRVGKEEKIVKSPNVLLMNQKQRESEVVE
jgi:hypothetical protein